MTLAQFRKSLGIGVVGPVVGIARGLLAPEFLVVGSCFLISTLITGGANIPVLILSYLGIKHLLSPAFKSIAGLVYSLFNSPQNADSIISDKFAQFKNNLRAVAHYFQNTDSKQIIKTLLRSSYVIGLLAIVIALVVLPFVVPVFGHIVSALGSMMIGKVLFLNFTGMSLMGAFGAGYGIAVVADLLLREPMHAVKSFLKKHFSFFQSSQSNVVVTSGHTQEKTPVVAGINAGMAAADLVAGEKTGYGTGYERADLTLAGNWSMLLTAAWNSFAAPTFEKSQDGEMLLDEQPRFEA